MKSYRKIFTSKFCTIPAVVLTAGFVLWGLAPIEKGYAAATQPGSSTDPLVSQSYVDSKMQQLQSQISSLLSETPSTGANQNAGLGSTIDTVTNISNELKDQLIDEVMAQLDFLYGLANEKGQDTQITDISNELKDKIADDIMAKLDASKDKIADDIMAKLDALYGFTEEEDTQPVVNANIFQPVFISAGEKVIGLEGTEIVLRSGKALASVPGVNGLSDLTNGTDILNGAAIPENHYLIIPRDDGRGLKATTDLWLLIKGDYSISK